MNTTLGRLSFAALVLVAVASHSWGQSLGELEQKAFRNAIERASQSVVQLQIIGSADRVDGVTLADGPATGVILSPDGYVVTSLYRFRPRPATVVARLADGRQFATEIVAVDSSRKLVLLKLQEAEGLPPAEPAPTEEIRIGQWSIALGRTFRSDRTNVAIGIVSAKNRIFGRALQTDAAVSAANYGGPLVDIHGRVLGILAPMSPAAEAAVAGVEWYDSGIGFAIPLAEWMPALERLRQGENLERGYMGIGLSEGSPRETPPEVKSVIPGGPAAAAGLEAGDVITAVEDQPLATQNDLKFAITPRYAGDTVNVTVDRGGESKTARITLSSVAEVQATAEAAAGEEETPIE